MMLSLIMLRTELKIFQCHPRELKRDWYLKVLSFLSFFRSLEDGEANLLTHGEEATSNMFRLCIRYSAISGLSAVHDTISPITKNILPIPKNMLLTFFFRFSYVCCNGSLYHPPSTPDGPENIYTQIYF